MIYFKPLTAVVCISAGIVALTGCRGSGKETPAASGARPMMVAGQVIQPRPLEKTLMATGSILANEEVELRSEVAGRVVSIGFTEGSFVQKNTLLVKLDDRDLQAQLAKLQVEEKEAGDDLHRKEKLLELKAVSREEYDRSVNTLAIVRAGIRQLQAQIAKTEVFAPFAGRVGLRYVSVGGYLSPATLIARLQQTDPVKIEFSIPEKYSSKLRTGQTIQFRSEGTDSLFSARIYAMESRVDPSTRSIPLRALCRNPEGRLIPGSFVKISLELNRIPDALVIPSEAIIPVMEGAKVYVSRNGKATGVTITTGMRTEREAEVTSGLTAGDTLITSGLLQLREGAPVKIRLPK